MKKLRKNAVGSEYSSRSISIGVSAKGLLSTFGDRHASRLIFCFLCFIVVSSLLLYLAQPLPQSLHRFSVPDESSSSSSYDDSDSEDDPFVNERTGKTLSSPSIEILLLMKQNSK